jgi:hypothetical protein
MRKIYLSVGAALAILTTSGISYHADSDGLIPAAGSHFSGTGGSLQIKTHNGFKGLGISGGPSGGEIDLGQKLTIAFDQPQFLLDLTLAFLYDGPEYNDGNELAAVRINGFEYVLTATESSTVTWTGGGTAENVSPAINTGGGIWRIQNPAGNTPVNSSALPLAYPAGKEAPNASDFSPIAREHSPK